jgi:hypothetical protein
MDCVPIREEPMEGRSTGLTLYLRFAVAALLCTAYLSGTAMAAEGSAGARPTLAVLPFENDSGAARQQFLADGMTDEMAVALSAVPGLAVVARSSSFQVKLPPALAAESRERARPPELRSTRATSWKARHASSRMITRGSPCA